MKTKNKSMRKAYRSPTEDAAIGHIMREWRREQKRRRDHEAYLLRKTAWEAAHPGKRYENRPRFNTRVGEKVSADARVCDRGRIQG